MALPKWPGAEYAYKTAYKILDAMGKAGYEAHTAMQKKLPKSKQTRYSPSEDMRDFIDALDKGNEEKIKGYNLMFRGKYLDKKESIDDVSNRLIEALSKD